MADVDELTRQMEDMALARLDSGDAARADAMPANSIERMPFTLSDDERGAASTMIANVNSWLDTPTTALPTSRPAAEAVRSLRQMLSREQQPPFSDLVSVGVIPLFVRVVNQALKAEGAFSAMQEMERLAIGNDALWGIVNLASGPSEVTRAVVDMDVVPLLLELAKDHNVAVVAENAAWAIGNIAGDCREMRDLVLALGGVDAINATIARHAADAATGGLRLGLIRNCAWTLGNLCRGKPIPPREYLEPALVLASSLLQNVNDDEVITDALWCFTYASEGDLTDDVVEFTQSQGLMTGIVTSLSNMNPSMSLAAVRAVGNFVTGSDRTTQMVIDAGAVPELVRGMRSGNLGNSNSRRLKEVLWTLSNIAAGSASQIELLLLGVDDGPCAIGLIVGAMPTLAFDVMKEAVWVLSNAFSGGTGDQCRRLVDLGALDGLVNVLANHDERDDRVARVATDGLVAAINSAIPEYKPSVVRHIRELAPDGLELPMDRASAIHAAMNGVFDGCEGGSFDGGD